MGQRGFSRQWAGHGEDEWQPARRPRQRRRPWGGGRGAAGRLRPARAARGPPPWVAGLFGLAQGERQRGPRVRRGDVRVRDPRRACAPRSANGEQVNGYQVIQQIAERSNGAWRPSPGSVYPTIQQLQDEGLLETDDARGPPDACG